MQPSPKRATAARTSSLRRARSTCSSQKTTCARPGFEGAKFVCTPPLRPSLHQAALWQGLRIDDLSVVATDHCPFTYVGQKQLGVGDFTKIPNGLPSLENRMDLIFQGVVAGEISASRWVEVTSTNPAKIFGLYPRKGTISAGVGRRHRHLRPTRQPDDLGRNPSHGRGLLVL